MSTLQIYVPMPWAERVIIALRAIPQLRDKVSLKRHGTLDLAKLRCFFMEFHGSGMTARFPLMYPLSGYRHHPFYAPQHQLHQLRGVDWIMLGRGIDEFTTWVLAYMAANPRDGVSLLAYDRLTGALGRERARGDIPVPVHKIAFFTNHADVTKRKDQLLSHEEAGWDKTGYSQIHDKLHFALPLIERYFPGTPLNILDIGCGLGQTTRTLGRMYPASRVVGTDWSLDSLEIAQHHFDLPNVSFLRADFQAMPFKDLTFDLIISFSALNIAANQRLAARESFRMLAPGGLFVSATLVEDGFHFWNFPSSLAWPTHSDLSLPDWYEVAAAHGLGCELRPWVRFGANFFQPEQKRLEQHFNEVVGDLHENPPETYRPFIPAAILAASSLLPAKVPPAYLPGPHADRIETIIRSAGEESDVVWDAAAFAWSDVASFSLQLTPEAKPFLQACLPSAAPVLEEFLTILQPATHKTGGQGVATLP
ncbi:Phthiotriol/phenolphthiotriol dimycocerosates methyltransferase [Fundidesulfovibrio magnetotacticus]|uniref:Phthiotriol/phenolphthiotriol dimycocerosates methyltransferase n=1 Tax=Fundidesulfovibrio magnetotacticus TaxID=2730080 RepID=A0A6V8M0Z9_9BACT|nr:class I SAM-dependent methyltransferase [Fundidesulfovibrio magnetotacticus]GFK95909.1 Phthiotriol/phenolphthiotriol dimycocerosates methyltransferase [Fundidesulfovibrio magnetotacticus]